MNIREKIGQRIEAQRKTFGYTRKALAELTTDLKQSRINNWERGTRLPGPEEIKQLASVLQVSPAYLMCLTDDPESGQTIKQYHTLIPLLDSKQACDACTYIQSIKEQEKFNNVEFISISTNLLPQLGSFAFALKMLDDSMNLEIRVNDIQIIDPSISPKPGDYVAVKISGKPDAIVCQYKKLSYTSAEFELLTLNDNWPNIRVNESMQVEIIGKVVQNIRGYL